MHRTDRDPLLELTGQIKRDLRITIWLMVATLVITIAILATMLGVSFRLPHRVNLKATWLQPEDAVAGPPSESVVGKRLARPMLPAVCLVAPRTLPEPHEFALPDDRHGPATGGPNGVEDAPESLLADAAPRGESVRLKALVQCRRQPEER